MDQRDAHMMDAPSVLGDAQSLEPFRRILEHGLDEINNSIEAGFYKVNTNLHHEISSIRASVSGQGSKSDVSIGGMVRKGFARTLGASDPIEPDMEQHHRRVKSLHNDKKALRLEIEGLQRDKKDLRLETEALQRDKSELVRRLEALEQSLSSRRAVEARLAEVTQTNRKLQEQTARFREIILSQSSGDSRIVEDSTIIRSFVDLRDQIQRIIFKFYRVDQPSPQPANQKTAFTKQQREFFDSWRGNLSESQLKNRTRAMMFTLLDEEILRRPIFGLDDTGKPGDMDLGLAAFEAALESTGTAGHEADISEWRTCTVKCASWLQPAENSGMPRRAADVIYSFMEPLLSPLTQENVHSSSRVSEEPYDHIFRLCTSAFDLTLLLRRCKDKYKCQIPARFSPVVPEEVEPQDSEGVTVESGSERVLYVLFGMLVKYPEHDLLSRLVLEKAHVVVCD